MCGVFGFSKLTSRTRYMVPFLAYAMETRGNDSWGGSDGEEVIKKVGPISEGFMFPRQWKQAIFHTRAATVGAVSERNAHPFVVPRADKAPIIGIHNGGVWNWEQLNGKYKRDCQVDSEHIFWQIAAGLPLGELNGRGTIAWFEEYKDYGRQINLTRWSFGDLEVVDMGKEDGIAFCSTKEPLERAMRFARIKEHKFYSPLKDCLRYVMTPDALLETDQAMQFGKVWNSSHNASFHSAAYTSKQCKKCHGVWTPDIVCRSCMISMRGDFNLRKRFEKEGAILLPAPQGS